MHVITIGMGLAGEDFTDYQSLQTALDGLHLFHAIHFETCRSEGCCNFLRRQSCIDVFTKPFVGNVHLF